MRHPSSSPRRTIYSQFVLTNILTGLFHNIHLVYTIYKYLENFSEHFQNQVRRKCSRFARFQRAGPEKMELDEETGVDDGETDPCNKTNKTDIDPLVPTPGVVYLLRLASQEGTALLSAT